MDVKYSLFPEAGQWLETRTNGASIHPNKWLIHQLIEQQAELNPQALAIQCPSSGREITYLELNQRANQLAQVLCVYGVTSEVPVCVCLERTPDLLIAQLAILKAGGAYVPLDPHYPINRLTAILEEVQAPLFITRRDILPALQASPGTRILDLDHDIAFVDAQSRENPGRRIERNQLAYIIYTSGSTGKPKGVQITHQNLINLVFWHLHAFSVTSQDRASFLAGIAFDAAVWEVWPYLAQGACIVFPDEQIRLSAELLQNWLLEQDITISFAPTPLAEGLLKLAWPRHAALRFLLTGGDRLHQFPAPMLPFTLVNNYGPTENTVVTTSGSVPARENIDVHQAPTLGQAIANVQTYILDTDLQPLPIGSEGELYIGGEGLARGYYRHADWTAERFIPHPFSSQPGDRLYKTGDVCRALADGNIEFIGRNDQQVKIRGFRIELGDIETALTSYPTVNEAVVTIQQHSAEQSYLVAYLVMQQGHALLSDELRTFMEQQLPGYMVPHVYITINALPLTPNGKIDRKALPEPELNELVAHGHMVLPRTETEHALATIWKDVLKLERIGIYDNIFALGAYSLLVTQIMSHVRSDLQVNLPLGSIFQAPTIAQLAELVEQARQEAQEAQEAAPVISPVSRNLLLPLSFSQERVWFIHQLDPNNVSYHFQATLRFTGPLQPEVLERSLNEIVRRHEVFRTTVGEDEQGNVFQRIHAPTYFRLPLIDLRSIEADQREVAFQHLVQQESRRSFDLTRLPLIRWTLVQLDDEKFAVIQVEHHLVHDGWSFNVFLKELLTLYEAFASGKASPLPEPTLQFADFVAWHRNWMQGAIQQQQLDYWVKKLEGAPTRLKLPTDRPRPAHQRYVGSALRIAFPTHLTGQLYNMCTREGVTLYTLMLTAFSVLMSQYADQTDFCLGSAIANRRWKETEGLIGMLVNNIVLRLQLSGELTLRDLIHQLRIMTMEAYEYQDVPFDRIVDALHLERDFSHNPLFQVMFSFHDSAAPRLELPGIEMELTEGINNGSAKFDMNVTSIPRFRQEGNQQKVPTTIDLIWEYNTDLFDAETIQRMAGHFQALLTTLVANPDQHIARLSLISPAEQQLMLHEWNATETPYQVRCIQQLFTEQAAAHPGTTALIFEGQTLTYQELDQRTNQLARYLQQKGIGPDTLVGVCMERSLELVVALLAVLKAGGAYVPLDPGYPKDRLAFMLTDANALFLITQEHLLDRLPEHQVPHICLDRQWSTIALQDHAPVVSSVNLKNLAYMIYTSGSTGIPKVAMNTHEGLCNRLLWMQEAYQLNERDRVLQKTPMSFDVSVWEFFWPLITGACLVLARPGGHQDSAYLIKLIVEQQITTLHFVPSMLSVFLQEANVENCQGIQRIFCSGEALPYPLQQECLQRLPASLYNLYGPTEAAIDVIHWSCSDQLNVSLQLVPIGRPIANTEIYLLDRYLHPVPIGVVGELYIGGVGLARGYHQRADLTAERFIPHPFSFEGGERLYRTGDLARYWPDGNIEYLGRLDNQVKLRGFRIELGEIESVLRQHPDVREAVVVLREDILGEKALVAYVVLAAQGNAQCVDLRRQVQAHLPEYMVPSFFVEMEELPLTPNGKLNYRALPVPTINREISQAQFVLPTTPTERTVADIWQQVLGVTEIGIHDNFFHLGGHSLLATRIISRVRKTFHIELPLRKFFESSTIAALSQEIEKAQATQGRQELEITISEFNAEENSLTRDNNQKLLEVLDLLSETEIDALLKKMADEGSVMS